MVPGEEVEVPEWFKPLRTFRVTIVKKINNYRILTTYMSMKDKLW
jgi:hypothetical protein